MLITTVFGVITAFAEDKGAEVVIKCDDETIAVGETFVVKVYLKNITAPGGIIGCDLPLTYDDDQLKLVDYDEVFPDCWEGTGTNMGMDVTDDIEQPFYLRVVCDANDVGQNKKYGLKEDAKLGFILTFEAISKGSAEITVDNNGSTDLIYVVSSSELKNYGADGESITVKIVEESEPNSSAPIESNDDTSDVESSADDSSDDSSDSTEDTSDETSDFSDVTTDESSQDVSGSQDITDENSDVQGGIISSDITEGPDPTESTDDVIDAVEDSGKQWSPLVIIIVGGLVVLVIAACIVLGVVFSKRAARKSEQELDDFDKE